MTLSDVKQFKNIYKNLQSFPEISPVQIKVLTSHKLQDHVNEEQNPFELKEDNPSQTDKLPEPIRLSKFVSHRARTSEESDS